MCFNNIDIKTLNNSVYDLANEAAHIIKPWGKLNIEDESLWEYDCGEAFAIARSSNAIIFSAKRQTNLIEAIDLNNGKRLWSQSLVSPPLPWGLIVDRNGQIIITMKDGQIMCFGQ